ncbi:MAG TPA: FG-GAP-like repeat-containing protein [Candidatus Didemnitutus sp.]|jgi:sugar lactone lactonase YvrE
MHHPTDSIFQRITSRPDRCARVAIIAISAVLGLLAPASLRAQAGYHFTTYAGSGGNATTVDPNGPLAQARFFDPTGVVFDSVGNLYVSDAFVNIIRKITPDGTVTTFAGTFGSYGDADGTGTAATFALPGALGVDAADNIYVADGGNGAVRKITPAGVVSTVATMNGGPQGMTVAPDGVVYFSDSLGIRKIATDGTVIALAGGSQPGYQDGTGTGALFSDATALALDGAGNVYVTDANNNAVRMVTPDGVVTTVAGGAGAGSSDGTGSSAHFGFLVGIAVAQDGNLVVSDLGNGTLRQVTPGGVVVTVAGSAGQFGLVDGAGTASRLSGPAGIVTKGSALYFADTTNNAIRYFSNGAVTTYTSGIGAMGSADGPAAAARFNYPHAMAIDATGNIYVADSNNNTIRKITPAGQVSTLAGTPGVVGHADGVGAAASFNYPYCVAVDGAGIVYVGDASNDTIRRIATDGTVSTLAGSPGQSGNTNGTGSAARFQPIHGMVTDPAGNLYVASGSMIRMVTPAGDVTTLAGSPGVGSADGIGTGATFVSPHGLAMDAVGNLFVADYAGNNIRKIAPGGVVTTVAGSGNFGSADGVGIAAEFTFPVGIAVDRGGFLYVTDSENYTLRRIAPSGVVTTIGGRAGATGFNGGTGSGARFLAPSGIVIDGWGALYFTDVLYGTIVKGTPLRPDFNGDGLADLIWSNTTTGDRAIWFMNGTAIGSFGYIAGIPTDWHIVGQADFDGDGQADLAWENLVTGDRTVWLMNGTAIATFGYFANVDAPWHIAAVGDFNGDAQADLIWENPATGDRAIWFMNGQSVDSFGYIAGIDPAWHIVGAADFDGDGQNDLVWENLTTGDRTIWYMNGATLLNFGYIASIPGAWHIASVVDMDGDGQPDLVWENTTTGDRAIWLMSNTTQLSAPYLALVDSVWSIAP